MSKIKIERHVSLMYDLPQHVSDTAFGHVSVQFCKREMGEGKYHADATWPRNSAFEGDAGYDAFDLGFSCQIDNNAYESQQSYAWTLGSIRGDINSPLEADVVIRMAKVLTTLKKNFARSSERFGDPRTFGQYVTYHLDGFGVKSMLIRKLNERTFNDEGARFREVMPDQFVYSIDSRVREIVVACRKKKGLDDVIPSGREEAA